MDGIFLFTEYKMILIQTNRVRIICVYLYVMYDQRLSRVGQNIIDITEIATLSTFVDVVCTVVHRMSSVVVLRVAGVVGSRPLGVCMIVVVVGRGV